MKTVRIVFLFCSLLTAVAASAQIGSISVDPPDPTSKDPVTLIVQQYGGCELPPQMTRNGFDIVVVLGAFACGAPPPLNGTFNRIDLGKLAAGTYNVVVTFGNQTASSSFMVLDANSSVTVKPSLGSFAGGTVVDVFISGAALCDTLPPVTCHPTITFGGVPATSVETINGYHFRATTPPHTVGAVEVVASGLGIARSYAFRYYSPNVPPSSKSFEMVLVPVILNAPGANGSKWITELSLRNDNDYPVEPWHPIGGASSIAPAKPLRFGSDESWPSGRFLVMPREASAGLGFHATVRDTSRSTTDWGTEIPVVHEDEFSTRNLELLDIPVDSRFRTMLRIYGSQRSANGGEMVGVSIYSMDDGHDLRSFFLPLAGTVGGIPESSFADFPLAAGVADLTAGLSAQRVGVRVASYVPIWAFVTITNNETQHVTIVTPH